MDYQRFGTKTNGGFVSKKINLLLWPLRRVPPFFVPMLREFHGGGGGLGSIEKKNKEEAYIYLYKIV